MKYNTPKQRLKVYEKMLLNFDKIIKSKDGFCELLSIVTNKECYINDMYLFTEIYIFKPPHIGESEVFCTWFPTSKKGYEKRYNILLQAIEDTKQAIKIQDQQKKKPCKNKI